MVGNFRAIDQPLKIDHRLRAAELRRGRQQGVTERPCADGQRRGGIDVIAHHRPRLVNPTEPGAAEEFDEAVTKLNMKGLKISPTYQAMDPRSKECFEIYEVALSHDVPVLFHCGGGYTGSLEFADPSLLDKVALTYPDLKIVVCHYGQPYMEQTAILLNR